MTDPIADMLTRIRNAVHARHQRVDVPASRFKVGDRAILEQRRLHPGFEQVRPARPPDVAPADDPVLLKYGPRGEK